MHSNKAQEISSEKLWAEIKRKGGRILIGTLLVYIFGIYLPNIYGIGLTINVLFFMLLIAIFLDYLRVNFKMPFPIYSYFSMRPSERVGLFGSTLAGIGGVLAITFFDFDIALAAVAMYLYGDAFAGIAGIQYGKIKIYNGKSLEGSLAMFVVSATVGFVFLNNIFLIIGMAFFATLIELLVTQISDDLVLPLYTAFSGQLIAVVLGLRLPTKGFSTALIIWLILILALLVFFGPMALYRKLRK